ncbi:FERRY endosomal RAB5 effector complex subunit 3-like [Haliotis asinina]|uniref:FERRY endosomal RAB5 effector complex subunit 3-like n=1 Tax=Haliotis asinina TaxID=109174 RepID=UPI0035325952
MMKDHTEERDFVYTFLSKNLKSTVTVPVTIPLSTSVSEFVGRLVNAHNLPCYVEDDLTAALTEFVSKETQKLSDARADEVILKVQMGHVSSADLAKRWTKAFTQEVKAYSTPVEVTNDQVFSEVYHTLIHSPALETLLNLEHTYALAVEDLTDQRDKDLQHLDNMQQEDMEQALKNVGTSYADEDINTLAQRHFENTQLINSKWMSELSNIHETQKREYREWVMKVHEDSTSNNGAPAYQQRLRNMSTALPAAEEDERQAPSTRLEESFTIHLGAQMKTTHNLRLLCTDVLDLCRHRPHTIGGVMIPEPQRLQTAMSLYSDSLCAIILLVDNRLNSFTGIKRDFARVCEQSTDFHFSDMDHQMLLIEQEVTKCNDIRVMRRTAEEVDKISIKSTGSSSSEGQDKMLGNKLQVGDVYITKHSNLSEVHIAFHLVCDDSVRSTDITSRHPVILSIRNIIKLCFRHNIHTLTIPLLLAHEMSEEMTIPWCMKRAELLFKCVKGFMIEMATYSSQQSRTIQFLVPQGLSEEMFTNISSMLPSIFRLSNPLVVKSGPHHHSTS